MGIFPWTGGTFPRILIRENPHGIDLLRLDFVFGFFGCRVFCETPFRKQRPPEKMGRFEFWVLCDGRVSPSRSTVAAHGGGQSDGPVHAELDGDASDEDALSTISDRLVETRRSLNGLVRRPMRLHRDVTSSAGLVVRRMSAR